MAARAQITLRPDLQLRARERAAQLGLSLAEYVRRLVARDLSESAAATNQRTLPPLDADPLMRMAGADDFEPQPIDEVVLMGR